MNLDIARITQEVNAFWDTYAPLLLVALGLGVLVLTILSLRAVVRTWQRKNLHAKWVIGFAAVQVGVTYAIITGVYEFFAGRLGMPPAEAGLLAVYAEAVTWAAVGYIYAHGKSKRPNGKPAEGFGDAGPLFWIAVVGGGTLAVLGSPEGEVAVGRLVIVTFGAAMWHIQLRRVTTRPTSRSRWRWTPQRLLLAIGALAPNDDDIADEAQEWQVRRLARAIRWSNAKPPLRWLGRWTLVRRAETTSEAVLAEARRRYAAAHVLTDHVRPDSPVMAALIGSVQDEQLGRVDAQRREIEHLSEQLTQVAAELDAQRDQAASLATEVDRLTGDLAARDAEAEQARAAAHAATEGQRAAEQALHAQGAHPRDQAPPRRHNGSATPAARRSATTRLPAQPSPDGPSMKDRAFALLDTEAAAGRVHGTQEAAEHLVGQLGARLDTVKRYVRDWRAAREQQADTTDQHPDTSADQAVPASVAT